MKILNLALSLLLAAIAGARAGDLNVVGNLSASNVTANSITLGGQPKTSWPVDGASTLSNGVVDTSAAAFYAVTLTTNVVWDFQGSAAGRTFTLKVAQDAVGGWTNAWGTNVLWAGGHSPLGSTQANRWDLYRFVNDGQNWLGIVDGKNYRVPCQTNCNFGLQFDGSQNYVECAGDLDLGGNAYTIEAWFKLSAVPGYGSVLIGKMNQGADTAFAIIVLGADTAWPWTAYAYLNTTCGVLELFGATTVTSNEWHHLAAVFDGSTTFRLYLDGASIGSQTDVCAYANLTEDERMVIGGFGPTPWPYETLGLIDEVRVSSVARYSSNFTPNGNWTTDSDTLALWKFDEGDGGSAYDETSNHDGTLSGNPAPTWGEGR